MDIQLVGKISASNSLRELTTSFPGLLTSSKPRILCILQSLKRLVIMSVQSLTPDD